jgi:hypothetical protein
MRVICKILILLVILYSCIVPVLADETEWVDPQEKTLRLKETVTRDGFIIEASDFYDNSSLITVYDAKHNIITKNITRINDYIPVNDRLNITVINLQEVSGNISAVHGLNVVVDQWVRIQTRVKGIPYPKLSITPKSIELNKKIIIRRTFIPGSEIPINFSVRNEGKGKLKNIILKINTSLPAIYGDKLSYEILELGPGNESETFTVRFQAPSKEELKVFLIAAEARGFDVFGKVYNATDSIRIEVNPLIGKKIDLKKYVSEKIYMGDNGVVTLSVKNNLSQKIDNITLIDSLPAGLEPLDANLTWNLSLGPNELKTFSYKIKPQKPGTYYFAPGSSVIEYKDELYYNPKLVKMIVNGPYVELLKTVSPDDPVMGDNITIRLDVKNIGDSNAIVQLKDSVPANNSLSSAGFREVLNTLVIRPGKSQTFSYVVNTTISGSFVIPPAYAVIRDQFLYEDERYNQKISSNSLMLKIRETSIMPSQPIKMVSTPKRTATPERTTVPESTAAKPAPGFQLNDILILLLSIALLFNRIYKKRSKKFLVVLIVFISLVILSLTASAYERPEFTDGLVSSWHTGGNICISCHYTLAETEKAREISRGCKCHSYPPKIKTKYKEVDSAQIFPLHREIICIRCHVGVNSGENISAGDFHRVMSRTACLECHAYENGNYVKPKKTKCVDCHSEDPHVVHGSKVEKMCVICHGEFGEKYGIEKIPIRSNISDMSETNSRQPINPYSTIGEFISKIIESMMKNFR